jgi:molybdate transport system substrate-binding protein
MDYEAPPLLRGEAGMKILPTAICLMVAFALSSRADAAEIKVLSDRPLAPALVKIGEAYDHTTGDHVAFAFAPSPVIRDKVSAGEKADVLIVRPDVIEELVKSGKVVAGPVIARVGIGLAVRADAPDQNIETTEALIQALLRADLLVFNNVASGNYFAQVIERLGLGHRIKDKVVRTSPDAVFRRVLDGSGNDLAVGTITQIMATKGLKLLGALPAEFQNYLVYKAAIMVGAEQPEAARSFVSFVSAPSSKTAFLAAGAN